MKLFSVVLFEMLGTLTGISFMTGVNKVYWPSFMIALEHFSMYCRERVFYSWVMESQTVMNTYYYLVWFYYRKINTFLVLLMPGGGNRQNQPPSTFLSHTHTIHSEDRLRTFPCSSDQSITTCCKLSKHENEMVTKSHTPLQYHGCAGCSPSMSTESESVSLLNGTKQPIRKENSSLRDLISGFSKKIWQFQWIQWISVNAALFWRVAGILDVPSWIAC